LTSSKVHGNLDQSHFTTPIPRISEKIPTRFSTARCAWLFTSIRLFRTNAQRIRCM